MKFDSQYIGNFVHYLQNLPEIQGEIVIYWEKINSNI